MCSQNVKSLLSECRSGFPPGLAMRAAAGVKCPIRDKTCMLSSNLKENVPCQQRVKPRRLLKFPGTWSIERLHQSSVPKLTALYWGYIQHLTTTKHQMPPVPTNRFPSQSHNCLCFMFCMSIVIHAIGNIVLRTDKLVSHRKIWDRHHAEIMGGRRWITPVIEQLFVCLKFQTINFASG